MARFTLYLTSEEDDWLHEAAELLGVTRSYIMRLLLRDMAQFPIGGHGASEYHMLRQSAERHTSSYTTKFDADEIIEEATP